MRNRLSLALASFFAMSSILSGCLKSDNTTLALQEIGSASQVIPTEIRDEFSSKMKIYEGNTPPDITSEFIVSENKLKYSSDGASSDGWADAYMSFYNKQGNTYEHKTKQESSNGVSEGYSPYVAVIGSGNDFTAYFISTEHYDDGVTWATTSNLISGTMTASGIKNISHAFIMLEKNDPNRKLMAVNAYRIFYDSNGLASFTDWDKTRSYSEPEETEVECRRSRMERID